MKLQLYDVNGAPFGAPITVRYDHGVSVEEQRLEIRGRFGTTAPGTVMTIKITP